MSEPVFTFLHAADLHLGASFSGLSREARDLSERLEQATYEALDNLVALARETRPAAVLLAGDNYNRDLGSAKALLSLRDACTAMHDEGIQIFMVHGNHDPQSGRDVLSWPDNVHIFGSAAVSSLPLSRDGETLALVHGLSHGRREETENLAAQFKRAPEDIFQIGLLHCQVGSQAGHLPYAPCTVADLAKAGMDYWALGHVHKRGQAANTPPAYYPGNTQGLHINEDGPKGCLAVSVRGRQVQAVEFKALSPVNWVKLTVSLDREEKLDTAENRIREALAELGHGAGPELRGFLVRLTLTGSTELNADLHGDWGREVLERLREWGKERKPFVWIKDVRLETTPALDMDKLLSRDDLLGETLRRLSEMSQNPAMLQELLQGPWAELYGPRASQARAAGLLPPAAEDLPELFKEAAFVCLSRLSMPEKR